MSKGDLKALCPRCHGTGIEPEQQERCPYGDPTCPCQDGDPCHYEDHTADDGTVTPAIPPPGGDEVTRPLELTREEAANRVRSVARRCGFACAEHGTRGKDLDLVLIPWTEQATGVNPDFLADDVAHAIAGTIQGEPVDKPHGRRAYAIVPDSRRVTDLWWIDLSIVPSLDRAIKERDDFAEQLAVTRAERDAAIERAEAAEKDLREWESGHRESERSQNIRHERDQLRKRAEAAEKQADEELAKCDLACTSLATLQDRVREVVAWLEPETEPVTSRYAVAEDLAVDVRSRLTQALEEES